MATTETRQRLNIAVPKDLIEELRARVPSRHRTAFVVQALARELHRLRLLEAIDQAVLITNNVKDFPITNLQVAALNAQGRLTLVPATARTS